MSKDIRSFFKKTVLSTNTRPKASETSSPQGKKRARRVIESDDEDDDIICLPKKSKETVNNSKRKEDKKKPEVIIDVENFFGCKPIQQKKQTINTKKAEEPKKKSSSKKTGNQFEVSFENDDELDASLLEADDEQLLSQIKTPCKTDISNVTKVTPQKVEKQEEKKQEQTSEQKKKNVEAYQKYLNRSGPRNPGSKTVPEGTPTCLQGLTFVITGVLESLEREEAGDLIKKCGGRVTSTVSSKTDYVVVGEEPGASKIQKANSLNTKKINEDELLDLIRKKSEGTKKREEDFVEGTPEKKLKKEEKEVEKKVKIIKRGPEKVPVKETVSVQREIEIAENPVHRDPDKPVEDILWVEKYKPKSTKHIIGQMGEKSAVNKLIKWLKNWHKNRSSKGEKKPFRPGPWNQNDDGASYRAALISGPPGIGKTTSAFLVCQELGLDVIELNSSDTRSKTFLQEEISELLTSKSIREYFQGNGESYQKHVLMMDEVDIMSGTEDRGGVQELIQFIKKTKVPIVCICNDRNDTKLRSLVHYCYDLRFPRPRVEQIKAAMKSICFKENLTISNEALEELIKASNHDVRQVLHNLFLLAHRSKNISLEEATEKSKQAKKPLNLGPWDVVRKVFSASQQEEMTFTEKSDLFHQDYSLGPLFVQETYPRVKPYKAGDCKKKTLALLSKAAESIAMGDVVEAMIQDDNSWGLLPFQAVFASVLPGHYMSGHVKGQIQFPSYFGKISKTKKFERLLLELTTAMKVKTNSTTQAINLDYLDHLRDAIVRPLAEDGQEGVQKTLQFMLEYHLTKDDFDNILELTSWPGTKNLFTDVDSKVKAALTKALKKECPAVVKKRAKTKNVTDNLDPEGEEVADEEEDENDDLDFDPMIKKGKPKVNKPIKEKGAAKEEKSKGASKKAPKKSKK